MDVSSIAGISGLLVAWLGVVSLVYEGPRLWGGVERGRERIRARRAGPQPAAVPIEQLATRLRRLLFEHETLLRQSPREFRVHHLWAVEGSISDCAVAAARELGLPYPVPTASGRLDTPVLAGLLRSLVDSGLVLPLRVQLMLVGL